MAAFREARRPEAAFRAAQDEGITVPVETARAELFPIREMSDGSYELAWPGTMRRAIDGMAVALGDAEPTYNKGRVLPDQLYDGAMDTAGLASAGAMPFSSPQGALRMGIKAYHGSPHDFDKFSLDHIGKGEGAQAYGHGLYFAENEGVAKSYRDTLVSRGSGVLVDGSLVKPMVDERGRVSIKNTSPDERAAIFARTALDDGIALEAKARQIRQSAETAKHNPGELTSFQKEAGWGDHETLFKAAEILEDWARRRVEPYPGRMYEVDLNVEPHQLLDWDKPATKWSPDHQEMLRSVARRYGLVDPVTDRSMGSFFYDIGHPISAGSPAAASKALRDAGFKGVQYLDQGSRGAGEGSRNFVIFDDNDVNILRKYANPSTSNIVTQMEREQRRRDFDAAFRRGDAS